MDVDSVTSAVPPSATEENGEKKEEESNNKEEAELKREDSGMEGVEATPVSSPVPATESAENNGTSTPTNSSQDSIGLGRIFDMIYDGFKSQMGFEDLEGDLDDEDFEDEDAENDGDEGNEYGANGVSIDPREPTDEEWTTIVIPAVRKFARREGMAPYMMEEWIRRANQLKSTSSMSSALALIRDELIGGGTIPRSLRPFVPRNAYGGGPGRITGSDVQEFLTNQWPDVTQRLTTQSGFYVRPFKGSSLHWIINFFDFDSNSPLGVSLMQLALQHHSFNERGTTTDLNSSSPMVPSQGVDSPFPPRRVEAAKIVVEMLFPESFDEEDAAPVFRLIRPTLDLPDDFFDNVWKTYKPKPQPLTQSAEAAKAAPSYYASLHISTGANSVASDVTDGASSTESKPISSASTGIESSTDAPASPSESAGIPTLNSGHSNATTATGNFWRDRTFNFFDFLTDLRLCLANTNPTVDMNSAMSGYQTTGFWKRFRCISAVMAEEEKIEGTGKVCLPASCLEAIYGGLGQSSSYLSQSGNLSPMTFELSGIESKVQTYCGVLEFTAQEGTVVIPSWMISQLNFQEGEPVMMRKITLPPGDFVKLQPHTDSYAVEGINPKALLEWRLRDFVALTKGEVLPIISHGHTFKFSVLDVRPGHAIAITDRDITVEFVDPIETSETASSTAPSSTAQKEATPAETKAPLRTGHTAHDEPVEGGKKCENCRHMIPEASYLTHSMRCPRMNYYCEACQMAVPKADKEAHDASMHSMIECGRCRAKLERRELPNHSENVCPARIVKCSYCELNMPASSKESHEEQCGARTMKCPDCGVRISMRFLEEHKASGCVKKEEPRRYGSPTRTNTSSTGTPFNPNAQMFICETCKAPIDSFDELQVHMLTVHYSDETSAAMDVAEPSTEQTEDTKPAEE